MKMTIEQFEQFSNDFNGICLECDTVHFGGVEGDAEKYPCDFCDADAVMGMHWLLFEGKIKIKGE